MRKHLDSRRKNEGELSKKVSVLSDDDLVKLIRRRHLVIRPFEKDAITCTGVDLGLGNEIARINHTKLIFDSRRKNELSIFFTKEVGSEFIIKKLETVLFHTFEWLELPADIIGIVGLRSSYTRLGLHVSSGGFVDPGFKGQLTVEVTGSSFPIKVYAGDKLFHITFVKLSSLCTNVYGGKYQNQKGVTLPIFP
jgi:dCTP deaminase